MNTFFAIVFAYLLFYRCVTSVRKRCDPRYHYASNRHPYGKEVGNQLFGKEQKQMKVKSSNALVKKVLAAWRHPQSEASMLPSSLLTWLAPLYWRLALLRSPWGRASAFCLVVLSLWAVLPNTTLYPVLVAVLLGSYAVRCLTALTQRCMLFAAKPLSQLIHESTLYHVLTMTPLPEPCPAETAEKEAEFTMEVARQKAEEAKLAKTIVAFMKENERC